MDIAMWLLTGAVIGWVMLFDAAAAPGDFSASLLFFVAAVSAVFLLLGNLLYERWGV